MKLFTNISFCQIVQIYCFYTVSAAHRSHFVKLNMHMDKWQSGTINSREQLSGVCLCVLKGLRSPLILLLDGVAAASEAWGALPSGLDCWWDVFEKTSATRLTRVLARLMQGENRPFKA